MTPNLFSARRSPLVVRVDTLPESPSHCRRRAGCGARAGTAISTRCARLGCDPRRHVGVVEFLRDTGSPVCGAVDQLLAGDIAVCDAITMELLTGARDEHQLGQLRRLLARATTLPTTPSDHESAATMYRACRVRGETVRKLIDCLIGAVAVSAEVEVLHAAADVATLARHTGLRVHRASLPSPP